MYADVNGALAQINRIWRLFEHNGRQMTKDEVYNVLKYAIQKGYKTTKELTDEEIESIVKWNTVAPQMSLYLL
jgi:hypothetical protein